MADRVTRANMARALANYAATLAGYGLMQEERAAFITWGAFYGQVNYVVSRESGIGGSIPVHDVAGFRGSHGSGFTSLREGYDRVLQANRTVSDVGEVSPLTFDHEVAGRVRAAVLAAHKVTA